MQTISEAEQNAAKKRVDIKRDRRKDAKYRLINTCHNCVYSGHGHYCVYLGFEVSSRGCCDHHEPIIA